MHKALAALFVLLWLLPVTAAAQTERLSVIVGGRVVGHLNAETQRGRTVVEYDYKNNGRGPTLVEVITTDAAGIPVSWAITGTTTFGSKVDERFSLEQGRAEWTDASGKGGAVISRPSLYVPQESSPWFVGIFARAMLKNAGATMAALPSGTLRLDRMETLTVKGSSTAASVVAFALTGTDLSPDYFLLDQNQALFAYITPSFVVIREGYENEEPAVRALATRIGTERYVAIQKDIAHTYGSPVRIRNVRVFEPTLKALSALVTVVMAGRTIAAVEPLDSPAILGEVVIDGAGGTLIPGMYEMHGHLSQQDAVLNIAAGITSVRDMGNNNAFLDDLIQRIEDGTLAGPRVTRSGFIEGRSPYSANFGIVVETETQALDAVRWYSARGYWQIKIYNSINPAWVPAMVKEARALGMRVAGHVPAFTTADAMIAAGYNEITHINQLMLGWVLKPGDDTRTLLRLTAMKRFPEVDLTSAQVDTTIRAMVDGSVAFDPTLAIHEELTKNRDGVVPPGAVDYINHMPIGLQRSAKKARADTSGPGEDQAYRASFEQILDTARLLHKRGVFIMAGTDLGGSFTYHRELELLQEVGMTPGEVLARATLESARYLGQDQTLGSIEKGKLADFFLVPGDPTKDLKAIKAIRMVVKDGTVYFPSEIYPKFGIEPFVDAPRVTMPAPGR